MDLRGLGSPTSAAAQRPGVTTPLATVRFEGLTAALVKFIGDSPVVVGAVAWLSHPDVLEALAGVPCALVVQKEPYLRPVARDSRYAPTRRRYAALAGGLDRRAFPEPLASAVDPEHPRTWRLDPVRVVGAAGTGNRNGAPLMHHKFLVRCELGPDGKLVPTAAWAGSANLTRNSDRSLEFAVEHHDPAVAAAFLGEFARVAAVSEPLAWTSARPAPQWRTAA